MHNKFLLLAMKERVEMPLGARARACCRSFWLVPLRKHTAGTPGNVLAKWDHAARPQCAASLPPITAQRTVGSYHTSSSMKAPDGRRSDVEGQAVSIERPCRAAGVLPLSAGMPWRVVASFYSHRRVHIQIRVVAIVVDDEPPPAGGPYLG